MNFFNIEALLCFYKFTVCICFVRFSSVFGRPVSKTSPTRQVTTENSTMAAGGCSHTSMNPSENGSIHVSYYTNSQYYIIMFANSADGLLYLLKFHGQIVFK